MRRDLALTKLVREKRPVYEVAEAVGFSDALAVLCHYRLPLKA